MRLKLLLIYILLLTTTGTLLAQTPAIRSFSPANGPVGTTVTITGINFSPVVANNIVFFGATKATVTSATATQLLVKVPVGATAKPITVTSNNLTAYSQNQFTPTFPDAGPFVQTAFDKKIDYAATLYLGATLIKDIDGDGKPDMVLANTNSTTMSVYRNINTLAGAITSGSFATKVDFDAATNPGAFRIDDMDGDGKPDIVVIASYQNSVSVLKNTSTVGNVSFAAKAVFATGTRVNGLTVADVNGDGKPDIVTTNSGDNTFSVLINTSSGSTISFAPKIDFAAGVETSGVIGNDLDGDGKPDLIVCNRLSTYGNFVVSVYMNTSTASTVSFAPKTDYMASSVYTMAIGDVDGDGKPDLMVGNLSGPSYSVLRNISTPGAIVFEPKLDFPSTYSSNSVMLADVDGDGKLDAVLSGNSFSKNTSVGGAISFDTPVAYNFNASITDVGDLDGDGKPDIVGTNSTAMISVIRNKINEPAITLITPEIGPAGTAVNLTGTNFTNTTSVTFGGTPAASYTVNSPTSITAVLGAGSTGNVIAKTAYGTGTGTLFYYGVQPPVINAFTPASGPIGTVVTITGKNFNPVAANNTVFFGIAKAVVNSATATQLVVTVPVGANYQPISVINNGLTAYTTASFDVTFANSGPLAANSFKTTDMQASGTPNDLLTADLDMDGKADLIAVNYNTSFSFFKNISTVGNTAFATRQDFAQPRNIAHLYIKDIDGDGKPDLLYCSTSSFTILKNTSSGGVLSFATPIVINDAASPNAAAIADFDNDGKIDIIITHGTAANCSIYRNTTIGGNISFAPVVVFAAADSRYNLDGAFAADLDGDGKMDLVTTNEVSTNQFTNVYKNTSTIGNISFAFVNGYQTGYHPLNIVIADVDGDGKPDMAQAVAYSGYVVFKNTTTNGVISFVSGSVITSGVLAFTIGIGDVDGDGKPDLVVPDGSIPGQISVYKNLSTVGNISFPGFVNYAKSNTTSTTNATGVGNNGMIVVDFDFDGRPDMAVNNYQGGTISVSTNTITAPAIASFTPTSATTGSAVTITGTNLTGATAVSFGGVAASSFTVNSPTSITAVVGAGATGVLSVTTPIATGTATGFIFLPAPTITAFTPLAAGPTKTITITGTNFTGATGVAFGGINAKSFTVVSATSITAVVDDVAASGNLTVTVPGGSASMAGFVFAPAPVITSFTPLTAPVGTTVNIAGTNFNTNTSGNVVYFGAAKAVVNTATTKQLNVTIPAGATYQAISVLNTSNALAGNSTNAFGTTFNSKNSIAITGFDPKVDFTAVIGIQASALSDIDGDGKPDLIVANGTSNTVSVYKNTAASGSITQSSFAAKIDFATGSSAQAVSIGDIDGDGKPDMAVVNFTDNTVSVYRNTSTIGNISFAAKTDFTTGAGPYALTIADVDGDGKPEIVVANSTANTVSVLRNISASGSIVFLPKVDFATGVAPRSVIVGDINGDGRPEILTANFTGNSFSVLNNISFGGLINASSFSTHTDILTGQGPQSIALGDINQDGMPDVIVANSKSNTVSVLANSISNFTNFFSPKIDLITGTGPKWVALGDMDGDGHPDIVSANSTSNTISVFRNIMPSGSVPAVSFAAKIDMTTGNAPSYLSVGDIDGDGKVDMITVNTGDNTFSILRNNPSAPATTAKPPVVTSFSPDNGIVGANTTITGDNFNTTPTSNIVFFGATQAKVNSATATQLNVTVPVSATYQPPSVLNSANNLTGYGNLPFTTTFASKKAITANDFGAKVDFATANTPSSVTVGDIDGDGKPDLVIANSGNTVSVYRNTSVSGSVTASSFAPKVDFIVGAAPQAVRIIDIDGDGKPDLVVLNKTSGTVSVLRNLAVSGSINASSFATKVDFVTTPYPTSLMISDMDGDGKPDILAVGSVISILLNNAAPGGITAGAFAPKTDFSVSGTLSGVVLGDMNKDGKPDLVVSNGNVVSIMVNTSMAGSLSIGSPIDIYTQGGVGGTMFVVDVDGDGKPDILSGGSNIALLHNISVGNNITASSFETVVNFTGNAAPYNYSGTVFTIADVDGDGKPDVIQIVNGLNLVSVFRNISTSTTPTYTFFDDKVDFTTGTNTSGLAVADIDGDGKPDMVVVNQGSNTFSVLRNNPVAPVVTNPPVITAMAPLSGPTGTVVTITGNNFNTSAANNIVYFGGVKAVVNTASSTSLSVTVPIGATYDYLTVLNTATKLIGYAPAKFVITFPSKNDITPQDFDPQVVVNQYTSAYVRIADIDGDGKPDLVYHDAYNYVYVQRNQSTSGSITASSFSATPTNRNYLVGLDPIALKVADVDGDGKPDILVTYYSFYGIGVSVLLNTSTPGNISFAPHVDIAYNSVAFGANSYVVNVGDVDGDGKPDILIANSSIKAVSVLRNACTPGIVSFAKRYDFETGRGSTSVNLSDIDGDGKPDLVVTNQADNTLSILKNVSPTGVLNSASFATHVDFATVNSPGYAAIGDLNADGKPDIVVTSTGASNSVSVFQNTSVPGVINTTSLAAKVDVAVSANTVEMADMDGDGKTDLVCAGNVTYSPTILRNISGTGTISRASFAANIQLTTTKSFTAFAVGDLDGDGKPDIVGSDGNSTTVFRNDPSTVGPPKITSFTPTSAATGTTVTLTGTNFVRVSAITFGGTAATSFNVVSPTTITAVVGAGATGKVALNANAGKDTIAGFTFIPKPIITYAGPQIYPTNSAIAPLIPLNTGGAVDGTYTITPALPAGLNFDVNTGVISGTPIAVSAVATYSITAANGTGSSTATVNITIQLPVNAAQLLQPVITSFSPASGPVGTPVVITGNNFNAIPAKNIVYFGATKATVTAASATQLTVTVPVGASYVPFSVLDITTGLLGSSNKPFAVNFPSKPLTAANFDPRADFASSYTVWSTMTADIDGDGKADIITANANDHTISIYRNTSTSGSLTTASFAPKVDFNTGGRPYYFNVGDIDGDGKPDIVVANYEGSTLAIFRNIATPGSITTASLAALVTLPVGGSPQSVCLNDLDGDGKLDIAVANSTDNSITVYRNIATAGSIQTTSFAPRVDYKSTGAWKLAVADMDGDGKPDMVTTDLNNGTAIVFRNISVPGIISATSFASPVPFAANTNCNVLKVADIDGDGKPDIVTASYITSQVLSILRNTSTAGSINSSSFATKINFSTALNPWSISVTDMDGDGKPDVIVGCIGDHTTSVFRNTSTPGSVTLTPRFDVSNLGGSFGTEIGDLDGDGIPDLAVAGSPVSVYRNNANGTTIPIITTFTPNSGPAGTGIIITGNNFIDVTGITIGGIAATNFTVNSPTSITAEIPAGANGAVIVTTNAGAISYGNFSILANPNINYPAPSDYFVGVAITPLNPVNTGGKIPTPSIWSTTTLAGNKTAGSTDGTGTLASFNGPAGLVADSLGNIYVAESTGNRVRKISPAGVVTTIAGTGVSGTADGPAQSATFNGPAGLTIDRTGNIYVADSNNGAIRKIDANGSVSTFVNSTTMKTSPILASSRPNEITIDSTGNFYVADYSTYTVKKITPAGAVSLVSGNGNTSYTNGNSTMATFGAPTGISLNSAGNIFVADNGNNVIRKLTPTGYTTTLAGSGFAGAADGYVSIASFNGPNRLYAGSTGSIYVTDLLNNAIREISPSGFVTTIAGGTGRGATNGIGTAATFYNPLGITGDRDGNLYVSENGNNLIRKISSTGYIITPALPAGLTLDKSTGIISGTPTAILPLTTYTITAKNQSGISKTTIAIKILPPYPVITTTPNATDYTSTSNVTPKPIRVDSAVTITHATKTTLPSATVSITSNFVPAEDVLALISDPATMGNITSSFNVSTGVLDLTSAGSTATIAQWQAALRAVTYNNVKANPTAGVRTISFSASDGSLISPVVTKAVNVKYNNNLSNLSISSGSLSPVFLPTTLNYADSVANAVSVITVTATADDPNATITVNGSPLVSGVASANINLNIGADTLTIVVTARDGVSKKVYHVIVNRAKATQTINFAALASVTYGSADYTPGATSNNTAIPITYSSSNADVATITSGGLIHITGAGSVTITASQAGNDFYNPATPVSSTLTVIPAVITITANNQSKVYGAANPVLTAKYTGFVNGDDTSKITKPAITTAAAIGSPVSSYPISVAGATSNNYTFVYVAGTLSITPAALSVTADDKSKSYATPNPTLTVTYTGFVNNDDASKLTTQATLSTTATTSSAPGTYPITVAGAASNNYTFIYTPGTLTIIPLPVITALSPATSATGLTVTLTGTSFTGATAVSFGGVAASSFTVVSPTSITAIVGAGASGDVAVTTPVGTNKLSGFIYVPVPTIAAGGPITFSSGGTVLLTAMPGTGYAYQWLRNGVNIAGEVNSTYTAMQSGTYTVSITLNGITQISIPTVVNVVPVSNIQISSTSATCKGSNNGIIKVNATQHMNYTATITGGGLNTPYPFTDSVSIRNLTAGTYNVCITIAGLSAYQQCYSVIITEPKDLSVYVSTIKTGNQATLTLAGGTNYNVNLNGSIITTSASSVTLSLAKGLNTILVSTDKACQGVVEKEITVANGPIAYPNPFENALNLALGNDIIKVANIIVFDAFGKEVYNTSFTNISGAVHLDLSRLRSGLYLLKLSSDGSDTMFKIIKK